MSTKNLARTAIEGGRNNSSKYDRRYSHRVERADVRQYIGRISEDPELADDLDVPRRPKVYKEFADKLSPVYAWLYSRVGRPWSEVRAEIAQKFDTRTIPGRHITYDHLLSEVTGAGEQEHLSTYGGRGIHSLFWIEDDLLCANPKYDSRGHRLGSKRRRSKLTDTTVFDWAGDRMVVVAGDCVFWAYGTQQHYETCTSWGCLRQHRETIVHEMRSSKYGAEMSMYPSKTVVKQHLSSSGYRQGERLSDEDMRFWAMMSQSQRGAITHKKL